jgi:hypothetical protein
MPPCGRKLLDAEHNSHSRRADTTEAHGLAEPANNDEIQLLSGSAINRGRNGAIFYGKIR